MSNVRTSNDLVHARDLRWSGLKSGITETICGHKVVTNPAWSIYRDEVRGVLCEDAATCFECIAMELQ